MTKNSGAIDLRLLKRIEELFRTIDHKTQQQTEPIEYPEDLLFQLRSLIGELELSENPELQKCARIQDHLIPGMSRRHFLNQAIPFERVMGREVKDADFLVTEHDRPQAHQQERPLILILENLRSSFNVGSILRLADGLGCREVILTGYTAGIENPAVQKTAMGAMPAPKIRHLDSTELAIQELRAQKVQIIGLETARTATPVHDFHFRRPTALVVGNERFGLDAKTMADCDHLVVLPLVGSKNSLNVATALSAVAFEWTRQFLKVNS